MDQSISKVKWKNMKVEIIDALDQADSKGAYHKNQKNIMNWYKIDRKNLKLIQKDKTRYYWCSRWTGFQWCNKLGWECHTLEIWDLRFQTTLQTLPRHPRRKYIKQE